MTPALTQESLDRLEALLAKATTGPFIWLKHGSRYRIVRKVDEITVAHVPIEYALPAIDNAELIVAAVNALPALIAAARSGIAEIGQEPIGCPLPGACSMKGPLSPDQRAAIICDFMGWCEDGAAWKDAHKLAAKLAGPVSGIADRLRAEEAGLRATLPPGYQWGRDAMEAFDVGKRQATAAILATLHNKQTEEGI